MSAVQQARLASEGYTASLIDAAMSRGVCFCSSEADDDVDRTEARLIVDRAVAQLDESERRLIWLRYFEQRSQSDIAHELGISQMQVSRLLSRLLGKLRGIVGAPSELLPPPSRALHLADGCMCWNPCKPSARGGRWPTRSMRIGQSSLTTRSRRLRTPVLSKIDFR